MMELIGKKVEYDGRIGLITALNRDTSRCLVEFYDGEEADPTDPEYPIYSLVLNIADLEPIDNDRRRKG